MMLFIISLKNDWWTGTQTLVTDHDGFVRVSGFMGEYEVSFKDKKSKFTLDRKYEVAQIIL